MLMYTEPESVYSYLSTTILQRLRRWQAEGAFRIPIRVLRRMDGRAVDKCSKRVKIGCAAFWKEQIWSTMQISAELGAAWISLDHTQARVRSRLALSTVVNQSRTEQRPGTGRGRR